MAILLSRDQFREGVFARDKRKCVICGLPATAAHHILERRLFPDEGYYLDNGASVCDTCHIAAEATLIDCDQLRRGAGITEIILPPHFFADAEYDKWGNLITKNGRLPGELFFEEPVQKMLKPVMHMFVEKVKYPRTMHFDWSPNLQNDDRRLENGTAGWAGVEYVFTEKMDGEGTTMYHNDLHARSLEFEAHPSRTFIKAIHAQCAYDIPEGMRICGENLTAVHSIRYSDLPSYFMVFNIWQGMECLSWNATVEWAELLGLEHVPVLWRGPYSDEKCQELCDALDPVKQEGLVARPVRAFNMREYPYVVGKCVRAKHVTTDQHWMRKEVEFNGLRQK